VPEVVRDALTRAFAPVRAWLAGGPEAPALRALLEVRACVDPSLVVVLGPHGHEPDDLDAWRARCRAWRDDDGVQHALHLRDRRQGLAYAAQVLLGDVAKIGDSTAESILRARVSRTPR
jgi:hypothetical protein